MNKSEAHYLKCIDENCEMVACTDRRQWTHDISQLEAMLSKCEKALGQIIKIARNHNEETTAKELRLDLAMVTIEAVVTHRDVLGFNVDALAQRAALRGEGEK